MSKIGKNLISALKEAKTKGLTTLQTSSEEELIQRIKDTFNSSYLEHAQNNRVLARKLVNKK